MTDQGQTPEDPKITIGRRDFLRVGAAAGAVGAAAWVNRRGGFSNPQLQRFAAGKSGEEAIIKTTCALCPSGCGLDVRVVDGYAVKVEGNPLHPLNQGVCCLKGQTALEVLYSPERISKPRLQRGPRGGGDWQEIPWEQALEMVAAKLRDLRAAGKAHSVALLHGELRGQMRGLVERFMQSYGSPNVISKISLGEQAARQASYFTQGINGLPVYDLNNANFVMCFGGNLLETNRHVIGYLAAAAFMRRGRPQRGKLVAVHPRLSLTGVKADEWVPIRPGTYAALALGMANVMINSGLYDADFVRDFTFGFEDFKDEAGVQQRGFKSLVLEEYNLERVSDMTGVATEVIARLAGEFATNRPAVAIMPNEVGELNSGNSLYTAMAIHSLNALVGSIDAPGGVLVQRFPNLTPWPEYAPDAAAQDGLAQARIDGAGSNRLPLALSSYQAGIEAMRSGDPYPVEALFLLHANPVYEIPNGGRTAQALLNVPFVVSFASTRDESAAHADLVLPASTFLEMWGDDFLEGPGYAGVSLRQPVVKPLGETRNPADVFLSLADMLGGPMKEALPWSLYWSLVQDRLQALDLDWNKFIANGNWSEMIYFHATPGSQAWSKVVGRDRLNSPRDGRFDFFSRELYATLASPNENARLPHFEIPETLPKSGSESADYPFLLVSQALITQSQAWNGIVPTLQESYGLQPYVRWESWVEMNPKAASAMGLKDNDWVWVESSQGRVKAILRLYEGLWPNAVFMPAGLGHRTGVSWGRGMPTGDEVGANAAQLMPVTTERLSGQAVYNPARVRIYKV